MKVLTIEPGDGNWFTHMFHCEGCGCGHGFNVSNPGYPIWSYNQNPLSPTIQPSILVTLPLKSGTKVCHSFITDGKIQYLNDCTHHLAGQTVELTDC